MFEQYYLNDTGSVVLNCCCNTSEYVSINRKTV